MRELHDELLRLAESIASNRDCSPSIVAAYPNYPIATAIEVYRNNYLGNLIDALASAYPVVAQLVGADFFRFLCRKFIERHPSKSGNLHHYGAGMSEFLGNFEQTQTLAYLPDVAALEWACHLAYFAPEPGRLDIARLAQVPPNRHPDLILHLHPAFTLLRSKHPISAIWRAHQPGAPADFDIDLGAASNALVSRVDDEVRVDELLQASALWLQHLRDGRTLGAATRSALECHPDFDLRAELDRLIARGVLVDFSLDFAP